ncbi:sensor histidine kinase, partial [Streptomyces sp. SID4917]
MTRTDHAWLLPSALIGPRGPELPGDHGAPRPRRTVRDWAVDLSMFLLAAGIGLLVLESSEQAGNTDAVVFLDLLSGMAACCALWLRRRWPV